MPLNDSIPELFGVPEPIQSRKAVAGSLITLAIGFLAYLAVQLWSGFPFFFVMTIVLLLHAFLAVVTSRINLLYLFRYFLVLFLILSTTSAWWIYGGEVLMAPFGAQYQTRKVTEVLVFAGLLSLCGSLLGWHFPFFNRSKFEVKQIICLIPISNAPMFRKYLEYSGLLLAIGFGCLYFYAHGGMISQGDIYTERSRSIGFQFNVFNIFQFTGIALLVLAASTYSKLNKKFIIIAILTLVLGVLSGSRADYLPQILILTVILFHQKIATIASSRDPWYWLKFIFVMLFCTVLCYYTALFVAIWRTGVDTHDIIDILSHRSRFINDIYGHKMVYLETGNMVLGGFCAAIVNASNEGFLLGSSYFNYILKAPPAFLGLPRPLGLEWTVGFIGNDRMSQGGVFEVAEAYYNFGLLGCFFVSFLISNIFARLLKAGLMRGSVFFLMWYLVTGFMGLRAIWYQNFAYFRIATIMGLFYIGYRLFLVWYSRYNFSAKPRIEVLE